MNRFRTLLIFLLISLVYLLPAALPSRGERPFIDIYQVPSEAMETGHLRIKLDPRFSGLAYRLDYLNGSALSFGIPELDDLNIRNQITEIVPLFHNPAAPGKFAARHQQWGLDLWFELRYKTSADVRDLVMDYRKLKDVVAWAEPEYKKTLFGKVDPITLEQLTELIRWTPNDPQYGAQWHYNNTGQTGGTVDADIDLPEAWNLEKGHSDVVVAVVDEGIQFNHPDLAANMWFNQNEIAGNGIDDDANGYIDDTYGYNFVGSTGTISPGDHGSHTSGTIAAVTNNSVGVAGIAGGSGTGNGVRLMSCQVFSGASGSGHETAPIYAADNGAAISQNSWGYTSVGVYDQPVLDAIDYFNANGGATVLDGGITIYAAGNDGTSGLWYPGCYSGAFSVAATNHSDVKSWYSNYGTWVEVSAPGGETDTVEARGVLSTISGSSYGYMQGTSMACPHTSGLAALIISYAHRNGTTLANTDVANIIKNTTDNHYAVNPSYAGQLGTGRINANSALLSIIPGMPSLSVTAPAEGSVFDLGSNIAINATASDSDGSITQVQFYIDNALQNTDTVAPYSWTWNSTGFASGSHTIKVTATDNSANVAERFISVTLLAPASEGFETGNFSAYPWVNSSAIPWTVQSVEKFSGTYAARSGAISHSGATDLSLTLNVTAAGNISFYQKVSSETGYDYLRFFIDGVQQAQWSGAGLWTSVSYPVTSGSHTFLWRYLKDSSVSSNSDCAFIDHIIFPPTGVFYAPPQNFAVESSHNAVLLTWSAPASGSPTGYRIYKNSSLLTTVTALSYLDTAVSNGSTYAYNLVAVYGGGSSGPTANLNATPNAVAPANLTALAGNQFVDLSWTASPGFTVSGYKIYRNGSAYTTLTGTSYHDTNVVNETAYTYYVTTLYTNPNGESGASNQVQATPSAIVPSFVTLGTGTDVTGINEGCPINIYYKSLHGQSVYTAAELNAAGVFGPINITRIGFYVASVPSLALPNWIVRMKHTTAANVATWQNADGMTTVYTAASYLPTAGDYDMLTLTTPFLWNGTDNIVIDTAFSIVSAWSSTGTVQYSTVTDGYRYVRSDTVDETLVFTGGYGTSFRPNVRLGLLAIPSQPVIAVNPGSLAFDEQAVGRSASLPFTISNTGTATLSGTITTPAGYSVQEQAMPSPQGTIRSLADRNQLSFSVNGLSNKVFNLSFTPTAAAAYNGNVVISSNSVSNSTLNLAVTGTGYLPPVISVDTAELGITLLPEEMGTDTFTIGNTGGRPLNYNIVLQELRRLDNPLSVAETKDGRSIAGSTMIADLAQYQSGTSADILFTVHNASTDDEWLKQVQLSFPAGITVNTVTVLTGGTGGPLTPTISPGNPTLLSWYGVNSYGWGLIQGNESATATVNITVSPAFHGDLILPFILSGDVYGVEPHTLTGQITIQEAAQTISWLSTNSTTGSISPGNSQTITAAYDSRNLSPGLYSALLSILNNDEYNPAVDLQVQMRVISGLGSPVVSISKSTTGYTLLWNSVNYASRYRIMYAPAPNGVFTELAVVTGLTYTHVTPVSKVFYKVIAIAD